MRGNITEEINSRISPIPNHDGNSNWKDPLSAWLFSPSSPEGEATAIPEIPELQAAPAPAALPGQPRVLELGCGDGNWCIRFENENPNWLVDDIDDTNHWLCVHKDLVLR
jgi:tRNA G46 methylase TrmB